MSNQSSVIIEMNLDSLQNSLELVGQFGNILSTEECLILHNSLVLLKNENHFAHVYLWGRIFGAEKDYYIAYGYVKDALIGRIFYYSTNCLDWGLLPHATEHGKKLAPFCTTKFQGDPALVIEILIEKDETGFGEVIQGAKVLKLKEEDRLAATIHYINEEAAVLPRGVLFKRPDGVTIENCKFEGLSAIEAIEQRCYIHYRVPREKWNTNLLSRIDYSYAMDFLDPLDIDIPEGCWIIQTVNGETYAVITNLFWPGLIGFHKIASSKCGYVYFGDGKKVLDVPFMFNTP